MKISIIIPTHNQVSLKLCLEALSSQTDISNNDYEVLVIENPKPTIETRSLVESYTNHNFIYATSDEGQANGARNLGVKMSRGEILCFTDDDCIPNPHWISRHLAMHTLYHDVGCVGGPMHLVFQGNIPQWLHREFRGILGECEITTPYENSLSFEVFPYEKKNHGWVSSGNMSVKKSLAVEAGLFPNSLSLSFSDCIIGANDEVDFTNVCAKLGSPGMIHAPSAWVNHQVPEHKTDMKYMKRRFFAQGFADGLSLRSRHSELDVEEFYSEVLQHHECLDINVPYIEEVRELSLSSEDLNVYVCNLITCKTCYLMGLQEGVYGNGVFSFND